MDRDAHLTESGSHMADVGSTFSQAARSRHRVIGLSRGTRRGLLSARPSVWYFRCSSSGNNSVVECDLAKVEVAGSNPVSRSIIYSRGPLAPLGTLRCVGPGCPLRCACFSGSGGRWPRSARSAAWVPIAHSAARASEEAEAAGPARRAPRRGTRMPTPLRVLLRESGGRRPARHAPLRGTRMPTPLCF